MYDLDSLDALIVAVVTRSGQLVGFKRVADGSRWQLRALDDSWIEVALGSDGQLSIGTAVGAIGPAEGSHRLNQLMLQYLGFHTDTAFCVDAAGGYRLQQTLSPRSLGATQLQRCIEQLASRAQAWRDLMQVPDGRHTRVEIPRNRLIGLHG